MITYKKPGLSAKNTGESMSDYIHEWQRPTLEGIIKQGFAEIDRKIDALCDVKAPQIKRLNEDEVCKAYAKDNLQNYIINAMRAKQIAEQYNMLACKHGFPSAFSNQASNNVAKSYLSGLLGIAL